MARGEESRYRTRVNHLVQKDIHKPIDAMKHFNAKVTDGRIPIVLTPNYPTLMTLFMKVPSGLWVFKQKWNAHAGMMDPGLKMFWPAWNRVSHIVTKQAVTYSNPVRGCPTSDNVMVDIDISISFQIGPTEDDAYTFVYSLGAHRFDELLYSLTEEAIRGLVHSVRHDQVHDLREEFAMGMKTDLNAKLKSYGVFIHNVKVTNVDLPQALSRTLEETTAFKTRMEEQEKNHENQMRMLLNKETQKLTALEKNNERAIQDLQAESVRAAIIRDETHDRRGEGAGHGGRARVEKREQDQGRGGLQGRCRRQCHRQDGQAQSAADRGAQQPQDGLRAVRERRQGEGRGENPSCREGG